MPIIKRIRRVGTSASIIFPKAIVDLLGWDDSTEIVIKLNQDQTMLILSKAPRNDHGKKDKAA